jgi:hypothetical protein
VIKTRVKDPVLLMQTVNQCVAQQPKGTSNPNASLINDIELMTQKELKNGGVAPANQDEMKIV